jgi:hypothetical protein
MMRCARARMSSSLSSSRPENYRPDLRWRTSARGSDDTRQDKTKDGWKWGNKASGDSGWDVGSHSDPEAKRARTADFLSLVSASNTALSSLPPTEASPAPRFGGRSFAPPRPAPNGSAVVSAFHRRAISSSNVNAAARTPAELRIQHGRILDQRRANGDQSQTSKMEGLQAALVKLKEHAVAMTAPIAPSSSLATRRGKEKARQLTVFPTASGYPANFADGSGLRSAPPQLKNYSPQLAQGRAPTTATPQFEGGAIAIPQLSHRVATPSSSASLGSTSTPREIRRTSIAYGEQREQPRMVYSAVPHYPTSMQHSPHPYHQHQQQQHQQQQHDRQQQHNKSPNQNPAAGLAHIARRDSHPGTPGFRTSPTSNSMRLPPMGSQIPQQPQGNGSQTPGGSQSASKTAFLSLFSTFYDSLSDSRVLTHTLEDQIRRSSALLNTLNESLRDNERMLEEMVDRRIDGVIRELGTDLTECARRIERLERGVARIDGEEAKRLSISSTSSREREVEVETVVAEAVVSKVAEIEARIGSLEESARGEKEEVVARRSSSSSQ